MADLITLERAKQQLPAVPATDDALIADLISACSAVIETDCNRSFALTAHDERIDGTGTPYLYVRNPPISEVTAVRTGQLPAVYLLFQDATNVMQSAGVEVSSTAITLRTVYNATPTANTFPFADYPTFEVLSAAVNALTPQAVGRWVATQPAQFAKWQTSDLSSDLGQWNARNYTVSLNVYWQGLPYFRYVADRGEIFCPSGYAPGYQNYRVQYTGGYSDVPPEIQTACAELVQLTFGVVKTNPTLQSETLDKYSYSRAAYTGYGMLSPASKKAIQQHKIYSVARYK